MKNNLEENWEFEPEAEKLIHLLYFDYFEQSATIVNKIYT